MRAGIGRVGSLRSAMSSPGRVIRIVLLPSYGGAGMGRSTTFQFRLRTMLLILAAIAIVLMPYGWTARHRTAVQDIRRAGGFVVFEHKEADGRSDRYVMTQDAGGVFRRALVFVYGKELLDAPVSVMFIGPEINDQVLKDVIDPLRQLPTIRSVQFGGDTKVTDDGVRLLESVPQLESALVQAQTSTFFIWSRDELAVVKKPESTNLLDEESDRTMR